ncbi:hypothetical protein Tco_0855457, partial [Tanacetum coccineum]
DNDDSYDKGSIISLNANMFETPSSDAIATSSPLEEPEDSLIMEDEEINTIPEKESNEVIKSSVENLIPIPNISITSPKTDFIPEEFAGELNLIDPILSGIDEDDFDEEEG